MNYKLLNRLMTIKLSPIPMARKGQSGVLGNWDPTFNFERTVDYLKIPHLLYHRKGYLL